MNNRFSRLLAVALLGLTSLGVAQADPVLTQNTTVKTRDGQLSSARKLDLAKLQFVETVCNSKANAEPSCSSNTTEVNSATAACLKARFDYEGSDAQAKADLSAKSGSGEREVKTSWLPCAAVQKT